MSYLEIRARITSLEKEWARRDTKKMKDDYRTWNKFRKAHKEEFGEIENIDDEINNTFNSRRKERIKDYNKEMLKKYGSKDKVDYDEYYKGVTKIEDEINNEMDKDPKIKKKRERRNKIIHKIDRMKDNPDRVSDSPKKTKKAETKQKQTKQTKISPSKLKKMGYEEGPRGGWRKETSPGKYTYYN